MNLWYLIFLIFCFIYKIESDKIRPNFDEIFGNGWDKNEREEKVIIKIEQIDQNEQNDRLAAVDQMSVEMGNDPNDQQKREIIKKFEAIKEKIKEKGKFQQKKQIKIEGKIGKLLGASRYKIYKWKKELNLNTKKIMQRAFYDQKKKEFIEQIEELKSFYSQRKQKQFAKELGISYETLRKWNKEIMPKYHKIQIKHSNEKKLKKMKQYFEIKEGNPKINDKIIAKKFGIGCRTLSQ